MGVCVCVWLIIFITLLNFTSPQRGARCGDECVCISVYLSARISHTQTAIFSVRVPVSVARSLSDDSAICMYFQISGQRHLFIPFGMCVQHRQCKLIFALTLEFDQ